MCFALDDDERSKPVVWCQSCASYLCADCISDWGRRARAGWKRLFRRLIGTTSLVLGVWLCFAALPQAAHAQIQYELSCPSGSSPVPFAITYNPSTNRYRASECVTGNGVITFQGSITPSAGLGDPGSNGVIFRSALNTTRVSTSADIIALWTSGGVCSAVTFLRGDGQCAAASATPGGAASTLQYNNAGAFGGVTQWTSDGTSLLGTNAAQINWPDAGICRLNINEIDISDGSGCNTAGDLTANSLETIQAVVADGGMTSPIWNTQGQCVSAAGTCGANMAGAVTVAAGATTVVVSTTRVGANSQIFVQEDQSLGALLSVTCNTGTLRTFYVTARTPSASFTITSSAAPVTNPACLSYILVN